MPPSPVILATDTHYAESPTRTAGVLFRHWADAEPSAVHVQKHEKNAAQYEPGAFFRRELPYILSLLEALPVAPSTIVIDGYVWLDGAGRKGLGAHLFDALNGKTPIIGAAKNPFAGSAHAIAVRRGASKRPLFITAAGLAPEKAAENIWRMHGSHRIPTLLKLSDRACREV